MSKTTDLKTMADVYKAILLDFLSILIFVGVLAFMCVFKCYCREAQNKADKKPEKPSTSNIIQTNKRQEDKIEMINENNGLKNKKNGRQEVKREKINENNGLKNKKNERQNVKREKINENNGLKNEKNETQNVKREKINEKNGLKNEKNERPHLEISRLSETNVSGRRNEPAEQSGFSHEKKNEGPHLEKSRLSEINVSGRRNEPAEQSAFSHEKKNEGPHMERSRLFETNVMGGSNELAEQNGFSSEKKNEGPHLEKSRLSEINVSGRRNEPAEQSAFSHEKKNIPPPEENEKISSSVTTRKRKNELDEPDGFSDKIKKGKTLKIPKAKNTDVTLFQKPKGNTNLGNTCYFNAALQALFFTYRLEKTLSTTRARCASAADCNNLRLLNDLLMLLTKQTESTNDHTPELRQVLSTVGQINHQFLRRTQEDSFELLTTLLGGIFDEIDQFTKLKLQRVPGGDSLGMDARNLFTGWFITVYVYDTCKDVEVDFEKFTSLSIPIIHKGNQRESKISHFELQTIQTMDLPGNDLENGLAALEHVEVYNERDLPCRTCKADGSGKVHRRLLLFRPPPVLVLHIDRFKMNYLNKLAKNKKKVQYDKTLDVSKFCSIASYCDILTNTDFLYELYAVIIHTGSLNGGHYYAFVNISRKHDIERWQRILSKPIGNEETLKREVEFFFKERSKELEQGSAQFENFNQIAESSMVNPKWFCVNDTAVTPVHEKEVLNHKDAYILFYEVQLQHMY